jgi:nickel-responsive transcriptional regulator NikR
VERVTISLEESLLAELDRYIARKGYQNRSEAIRDLARSGLEQAAVEVAGSRHCVAALVYVYDHRYGIADLPQARQHAEAIEVGHDEVEHDAVEAVAAEQHGRRRFAGLGDRGLMAELANHVVEQPALDRIVVDNENASGHGNTPYATCAVSKHIARVALRGR